MSERIKSYYPTDENPFENALVGKPILDGRLPIEDEFQAKKIVYEFLGASPFSNFRHPDSGHNVSPIHTRFVELDREWLRQDLGLGDSASIHSIRLLGVERILSKN